MEFQGSAYTFAASFTSFCLMLSSFFVVYDGLHPKLIDASEVHILLFVMIVFCAQALSISVAV